MQTSDNDETCIEFYMSHHPLNPKPRAGLWGSGMVRSTLGSGEIYFEVEGLESIMRGSFTAMSPKSYYGIFLNCHS
jgi:hypothetical protein